MKKMFYFNKQYDGQEYTVEALLNLYQGDCISVDEILVYDAFGEQLKGIQGSVIADEDVVMYEYYINKVSGFSTHGQFEFENTLDKATMLEIEKLWGTEYED